MQGKTILEKTSSNWDAEDFEFRNSKDKKSLFVKSQMKNASRKFRRGNKININNIND